MIRKSLTGLMITCLTAAVLMAAAGCNGCSGDSSDPQGLSSGADVPGSPERTVQGTTENAGLSEAADGQSKMPANTESQQPGFPEPAAASEQQEDASPELFAQATGDWHCSFRDETINLSLGTDASASFADSIQTLSGTWKVHQDRVFVYFKQREMNGIISNGQLFLTDNDGGEYLFERGLVAISTVSDEIPLPDAAVPDSNDSIDP